LRLVHEVLDRFSQAFARGGARCASQVIDRGAQAGTCGNQMGTRILEVACYENGIRGGGEYCGGNDAQLDPIDVFSHEA
jgi:hypothetical protein